MASARTKPSASSTATEIVARNAVTQSEWTQTGSFPVLLVVVEPDPGCSRPREKSYWTKLAQIANPSGKIVSASTRTIEGATRSQRMFRSTRRRPVTASS